jgi:hypothetical protein
MRRVLFISICLYAFVVTGLLVRTKVIVNADDEKCAATSGDANGDGTTDMSDAIYILSWQFLGTADPLPLCTTPADLAACTAELSQCQAYLTTCKSLPATGQTKCYNTSEETACGSTDFPGQDGFYQAGCPTVGRFWDNGDGTVTDNCTGLMWQRNTADVTENASIGEEDMLTWQAALEYCEGLSFAGHDDWRLPNVRELQSIVDYGRREEAIDPIFEAVSHWYWSSSTFAFYPDTAWYVHFGVGDVTNLGEPKDVSYFVRAVRNAP